MTDRRLDRRVLRGAVATIGVTWTDQDDAPVAAPATPTVSVVGLSGAVVHTGTSTPDADQVGRYTVTLPAAATAQLDILTATWTAGVGGPTRTTTHEVAGGFFFNLYEARTGSLSNASTFPDERILLGRLEVEDECEFICGVAFVPRVSVAILAGAGSHELQLPHANVRAVRSITVTPWQGTAAAWTVGQLAATRLVAKAGRLISPLGFADGDEVVVVYEHGYDRPPAPIAGAALRRLRSTLLEKMPEVYAHDDEPPPPVEWQRAGPYRTGDDVVDAVYFRYSLRQRDEGPVAASGQLVYEPSPGLFRRRSWV